LNFPTTPGAFETTDASFGRGVAFVTKFNASGSALAYSTYLGGPDSYDDAGEHIAVDSAGNAYVAGQTLALDFPTTPGAFQTTTTAPNVEGFVTKLNASGSALVYSTYLGGTTGNGDAAYAIAVDAAGSAYVTGQAGDTDFPTTDGSTGGGIFITKL